jgi:hypothetical protein
MSERRRIISEIIRQENQVNCSRPANELKTTQDMMVRDVIKPTR